jgi:hypothetical protein
MLVTLREYNAERVADGRIPVRVGRGLNTGL